MRGASGIALKRTKNTQPAASPRNSARLNSASPRYEKQVDDPSSATEAPDGADDFWPLDTNSDSGQPIRWNITFLVLANRLGKVYIYRFNKAPSLWIFGPQNALRKIIIYLITNQLFELFIILTILVNCVLLALEGTPEEVEYMFTAIYTSEMVLKILAKGFILHKFAYLRDPWNWLDFIVVILGYLTLAPNVENLSGVRTFRVLRALRTISAIEGLKTMVNALLKSMRMLGDVLILTSFFICVFALVGLQLFAGVLHNRCIYDNYVPSNISNITSNATVNIVPMKFLSANETANRTYEPVLEYICGNNTGSRLCPMNYTCTEDFGPNPNYGFTSFDNIGWAVLTSFQLVTLDYWENVYELVMSAVGPWYIFYFMLVIFFGSFYLINLVLAVVAVSYQEETCIKSNMLAELGAPIYRISIFQESQYNRLRQVATSYSLHRRIMPKMIYEDPVIGSIAELSCVNKCNNVIVLSRNNSPRPLKYERASREFNNPNIIADNNNGIDSGRSTREQKRDDLKVTFSPSTPIVDRKTTAISTENPVGKPLTNGLVPNGVTSDKHLQLPSTDMVVLPSVDIDELPPVETKPDQEDAESKSAVSGMMSRIASEDSDRIPLPYAGYGKHELKCGHIFRQKVHAVTVSPWFEIVITLCIIVNTVILAVEHHGMDEKIREGLNLANHVFTAVFILEMILKLIAFGPRGYVKSKWNIFDGTVVCISIIDTVVEIANQGDNGDLTILRSFRLFRVFKLAQSWSTMRMLLSAIGRSLGALGNLCLILGIIVYMLAVVGVNLFGDKYDPNKFPDKRIPVWNFSNFGHSVLMLFRVLCGEWIEPLYDAMQTTGAWAIVFFLPALIVGNFLVLNLFLALLLNSFSEQALEEELKKRKFINAKLKWNASSKKMLSKFGTKKDSSTERDVSLGENSPNLDKLSAKLVKQDMVQEAAINSLSCVLVNGAVVEEQEAAIDEQTPPVADPVMRRVVAHAQKSSPSDGKSGIMHCCGRIRHKCRYIIQHPYFENLILVLICVSSLILVFEDIHLSSKPTLEYVLKILNLIFCILFFIEMVLKLIGLGLVAYFKNPWNILDFIIVIVSVAGVVGSFSEGSNSNVQSLKSLRTLRALRPLRAVSRWEGMKIVVNSLLKAIPSIANVLLVCMFFWLIFSILGVQFFGGKFYKCIDAEGNRILASLVPNKTVCLAQDYRWRNSMVNFDNTLNGFLALFQVATFEGWMEVMRDGVDSVDFDKQPIRDNKFAAYFFFVVFIIVGSFFILNLFISVIIDNFYRLKKQYDDGGAVEVFLTDTQKQWFLTVKKALSKKPHKILKRPRSSLRGKLFDFVTSRRFETFIMMMILANIVCMMVHHYKESDTVTQALRYLNIAFCIIFTVEGFLRIFALGREYFKSAWNVFDFVVVLLSYVGLVMDFMEISISFSPSILRVARVLRIGRLLRYFTAAKGIRRLLVALIISLPALVNIGALLFLILFIYSIIGMSNFGYVKKHGAITQVVNFETFGSSMLVLFRLTTSAGWNEVLDALMVQPPYCDPKWGGQPNGDCGTPWQAILFLVTYILITFLIIVNMYIAIILENFNQAHQQEESGVTDEDIEMYYTVWQQYDPLASQYIHYDKMSDFVANLDPPLGIPVPNKIAVHNLDLPLVDDEHIHCTDLLQALVTRYMGEIEGNPEHYNTALECVTRKAEDKFPVKRMRKVTVSTMEKLSQVNAAILMQRCYRKWKMARERRLAMMDTSHMSVRDVEEGGGAGPSRSRASSSGSRRVASSIIHRTSNVDSKRNSVRSSPVMDEVKNGIALEAVEQVDVNAAELGLASQPRAHRTSINVISPATLAKLDSESGVIIDNRRKSLTESSSKDWQSSFESTSTPEPELTRPFSSSRENRTSDYDSISPRSNIIEEESPSRNDKDPRSNADAIERRKARIQSGSDNPNFQSSLDDYNSTTSSGISSKSVDVLPDINM